MGKKKLSKRCLSTPGNKAQKTLRKQSISLHQAALLLAEISPDSKSTQANIARMAHALTPKASKQERRNLQQSLMQLVAAPADSIHTPYKKNPCSGCPALRDRPCRCAMKRVKH